MSSETYRSSSLAMPQRWTVVLRALDPRVLVPALVLCCLGLLALASDRPEVVPGQARWMAVGVVLCVATVVLPYRRMLALIYPVYGLVLLSLVAVLLFGRTSNGAQRWLQLGPFGFQPSEFAKCAMILAVASWLAVSLTFRISSLAALTTFTLTPLYLWVTTGNAVVVGIFAVVAALIFWRHRSNIRNLLSGTEPKIGKSKTG